MNVRSRRAGVSASPGSPPSRLESFFRRPRLSVLAAALLSLPLLAGLGSEARAQTGGCVTVNSDGSYTVPHDWALVPEGVFAGQNFRLLFITSTTYAPTATDIATYNGYVRTRARAGHGEIADGCADRFAVVGSTQAVDVRTNTRTRSSDTGAVIHWLNGRKLADDYADFYDGSWDSSFDRTESGSGSLTPIP